jgi:hypothetical protein
MILALFMLVLLTATGGALLFTTRTELQMGQADLRSKQAFYLAEAGQEDGRLTLFSAYGGDLTGALINYAGGNGSIDFDPTSLSFIYDADGDITGLTGFGDDVPLRGLTPAGEGFYAAFVTNDPSELATTTSDINERVMIYGIGAGADRSLEIVQALVHKTSLPPIIPPATITILGPNPTFEGGESDDKFYTGNDCADPSIAVPVVGVIGSAAEAEAESGVNKPLTFVSGSYNGVDTVDDVDGVIEPDWKNCEYLHQLAQKVKDAADVVGDSTTANAALGTLDDPKTVYIEGDYTIDGGITGAGMLWVTGNLTWDGRASWYGPIYAIGKGNFLRNGGGSGVTDGAVLVANIAGPDGTMWTDDDCSGPDGIHDTSDDGIDAGVYENNGGGDHTSRFCRDAIRQAHPDRPYTIMSFRQR